LLDANYVMGDSGVKTLMISAMTSKVYLSQDDVYYTITVLFAFPFQNIEVSLDTTNPWTNERLVPYEGEAFHFTEHTSMLDSPIRSGIQSPQICFYVKKTEYYSGIAPVWISIHLQSKQGKVIVSYENSEELVEEGTALFPKMVEETNNYMKNNSLLSSWVTEEREPKGRVEITYE
jgi:hypothetical protein